MDDDLGFDRMLVSEVKGREIPEMLRELRWRSGKVGGTGPGLTDIWVDQVGESEPIPTPDSLCKEELEARLKVREFYTYKPWYNTFVIHQIARGFKQIEIDAANGEDSSALKEVVAELIDIIEVGCGYGTEEFGFLQDMKARHRKNLGQEE